jgi:sporulation protein YlmC with PRC-barrel domain
MDIPLNVEVHCPDGRCGRSTYIIMNPATDQLTHVVVREQWPSQTERLVPIDWVAVTTRDVIVLKHPRAEFTLLDPFNRTDFIQRDVPHYATDPKLTLIWPYVVPAARVVEDVSRQIPAGELAVRRGAKVRATDGRVGQVDEFLVDPETGHITHLVLREGLPWDRKHVNIPVSEIDRIEENTVYLKRDKKGVGDLPFIPLRG